MGRGSISPFASERQVCPAKGLSLSHSHLSLHSFTSLTYRSRLAPPPFAYPSCKLSWLGSSRLSRLLFPVPLALPSLAFTFATLLTHLLFSYPPYPWLSQPSRPLARSIPGLDEPQTSSLGLHRSWCFLERQDLSRCNLQLTCIVRGPLTIYSQRTVQVTTAGRMVTRSLLPQNLTRNVLRHASRVPLLVPPFLLPTQWTQQL